MIRMRERFNKIQGLLNFGSNLYFFPHGSRYFPPPVCVVWDIAMPHAIVDSYI